ncbi:MAG: hypothetical protein RML94_01755 [Bacteroidia bacterium]|nr:hypothetical protein [Bacteroidia bacterium]
MGWDKAVTIGLQLLPILSGGGAADRARRDLEEARKRIESVRTPSLEEVTFNPELHQYLRDYTPEEIQALYTLGPSAFEAITTDPRLRADRELAIAQARQRALAGFTAEDRAALEQYMQAASAQAQSAQKQILEDAQRRGMVDSGTQLMAALQGGQAAANLLSNQALQQAALKLRQQQDATTQLSALAGALEQSDYQRAAELAQRRDFIEQFNQQLRQKAHEANVQARNVAQLRNIEKQQELADKNVQLRNLAKERQANMPLKLAEFDLAKIGSANKFADSLARFGFQGRQAEIEGISQLAQGIGQLIGLFGKSNVGSGGGGGGAGGALAL